MDILLVLGIIGMIIIGYFAYKESKKPHLKDSDC
jgi:hypothetical protein